MKRLTIEQAENLPMREGFNRKRLREGIWFNYYRTCDKMNLRIIRKFILKYVNKKFDDCYSDFIHKIKTLHISNENYIEELKFKFKDEFSNFSGPDAYWYHTYYYYFVDDGGIIRKNKDAYKRKKSKPEIGVTTLYRLDMNRLMQENYDLYKYAGRNRSYKFRSIGLTSDELRKEFFFDDMDNLFKPYIVTVKVGTPLTGKDLIRYYEKKRAESRKVMKKYLQDREEKLIYFLQEGKRSRRIKREQDPTCKEFTKNVLRL